MPIARVLVLAASAALASGAQTNVPETFGDFLITPTADSWLFKSGGAISDAGEHYALDHALLYLIEAPPGGNNGFHVLHPAGGFPPNPVFVGDYTAAGATAIRFRARHKGIGQTVVLRATLFDTFDDGVDFAYSTAAVTITPEDTDWRLYVIPIRPEDLIAGGDNGRSAADILAAVAQVGLRHDPDATGPLNQSFLTTSTGVFFDDIELITYAPPPCNAADIDGNGILNLDDITYFAQTFLSGCDDLP